MSRAPARSIAAVAFIFAALALASDAGGGAPQQPSQPTFRAGVDVVSLNVTVSDRDGRFVTGVAPTEFLVYEDGVQQEITYFSPRQLPIALANRTCRPIVVVVRIVPMQRFAGQLPLGTSQ